jgi:hypothetical protein
MRNHLRFAATAALLLGACAEPPRTSSAPAELDLDGVTLTFTKTSMNCGWQLRQIFSLSFATVMGVPVVWPVFDESAWCHVAGTLENPDRVVICWFAEDTIAILADFETEDGHVTLYHDGPQPDCTEFFDVAVSP